MAAMTSILKMYFEFLSLTEKPTGSQLVRYLGDRYRVMFSPEEVLFVVIVFVSHKVLIFFFISPQNIYFGYSLEAP